MSKKTYKIQNQSWKVRVQTVDGESVTGSLNILGFDRLSDYLHKHGEEFIMIYNGGTTKDKTLFVLKENIILIEDLGEELE
jgi:hypothetical protein